MKITEKIKAFFEKKKLINNNKCDDLIRLLSCANTEAGKLTDSKEYIDISKTEEWYEKYSKTISCNPLLIKKYKKATNYYNLKNEVNSFNNYVKNLEINISAKNDKFVNNRAIEAYGIIGDVEGRPLDKQQMSCIVKEPRNHLIIAGAGTGKTTTVIGRIKYLLKTQKCSPEDILVLSFTHASASEMKERILKETNSNIMVSTFHKLGMSIIAKAEGVKPNITNIDLRDFVKSTIAELMKQPWYLLLITSYTMLNKNQTKTMFDFKSMEDYNNQLRLNPPITLNGKRVKSYGEMEIADFLYSNNIKYEYEAPYKVDTRTEEYGQYHPDFYLPDYDIYIEYFGINRKGMVPSYFSGNGEKTATQLYRESMEWKFKIHKKYKTTLIPVYAYEKLEGNLLTVLEERLKKHDVELVPKDPKEIWKIIEQNGDSPLDGLIDLFVTVINLLKSNDYSMEYFISLAANMKQRSLISLIEPIYSAYEEELTKKDEIDFNDMINRAAEYVKNGKVQNTYSYVIVDEYQDISKSRFNLLNELRKSKDYNLFCVGDDWQSIYRFAGSDINYIVNFKKYWGKSEISKIEKSYRMTGSLSKISSWFITQNPNQIKKHIISNNTDEGFSLGEIIGYNDKNAVYKLASVLSSLPKNATVFLIGRYSFDLKNIDENELFDCKYDNTTGFVKVVFKRRNDLQISFMTAHKSKGLQADYVFIINNRDARMGFPSQITDDQLIDLLLENSDEYPYAEERRLFYVALTRSKKKTFLLEQKGHESVFVKELQKKYENELTPQYKPQGTNNNKKEHQKVKPNTFFRH